MYFSVIIPVYNCKKYVSSAIQSVLNQPFKDLEIILVDDGSSDGSDEICDTYATLFSYISVIHQENKGVSAARNSGIRRAAGKYVLFLDADDMFVENMISQSMKEECEKGYDVLMYSSLLSDVDRKRFGIDMSMPDAAVSGRQALPISGHFGSCVYNREMLLKNHIYFDEGIRLNEDEAFKMKAMYAAQIIKCSSSFLYIYNKTPDSSSRRETHIYDYVRAWEKAGEWLEQYGKMGNWLQARAYVQQKIVARQLLYAKLYVQQGYSRDELYQELQRLGIFETLKELPAPYMIPGQREELILFQKDFNKFVRTARREGYKIILGRRLLKISFIRHWRDAKRMPWLNIHQITI